MLTMPSFKKSLMVEQFQGNYLKIHCSYTWTEIDQTLIYPYYQKYRSTVGSCVHCGLVFIFAPLFSVPVFEREVQQVSWKSQER